MAVHTQPQSLFKDPVFKLNEKKKVLFTEADSRGFMYFNLMMLHDPWWLFNYFLPLLQYVNNFASLFIFMYIQKSIQLLCDYIVVWLFLCMCGLKRWCLFFFLFSFNVVCIHRSVLLPATHIPTSLLPELPWAKKKQKKKKQIFTLLFFFFFFLTTCLDGHVIFEITTAVLSQLSHNHQSPTRNKKKNWKKGNKTHTNW